MSNPVQTTLKVGQISYTNCIPFYHNLSGFNFTRAVPAEVNDAMRRGLVDLAPVSSLEYLMNSKDYYLLPDLAIGARDFSGSVILFSKEKIEGLNGEDIAVTRESLSSVTLLKILMKYKYQFANTFTPQASNPDEMLEKHKAALVIGDDALFYKPKNFVYKYDLAELWWNWTGKPFCFAVWTVRRDFADKNPDDVNAFYRGLRKNLETNLLNLENLIKEATKLTFLDDKFSKIFGYLFNLNYGLDSAMQEGLQLFYQLAHRLEIAPQPAKLDFFETNA